MLRTPVLRKGRKVKHHYKAFRTVLSMMVEFNLARQVLGVKHKITTIMLDNQTELEITEYEEYLKSLQPIYIGESHYGKVEVYHYQNSEPELHLGTDGTSILSIHSYDTNLSLKENIKKAEKEFEEMMTLDFPDYEDWE